MTHNLSKDEIEFFYNILYKNEHESLAGYQDKEVEKLIGSKVALDDNHTDVENIKTEKKNCLQFPSRKYKCRSILHHVRNAFAHGNIKSIENDSTFLIQDYSDGRKRKTCNMLGIISKKDFYELIDAMEKTRKVTKKKNEQNMKEIIQKTTIILLFFLLGSMNLLATVVTVGSLKYTLDGYNATVFGYDGSTIPEDLVIPETIMYNGLEFNVAKIDSRAFSGCTIIKKVKATSVKEIIGEGDYYAHVSGYGAFCNCKSLQEVILPQVEIIGGCAFRGCGLLRYIDFGTNLKVIDAMAFYYCTSLTYLVFPKTLVTINSPGNATRQAFSGCTLIRDVIYLGDNIIPVNINYNAPDAYNIYTRKDFIEWSCDNYTYSGQTPTTTYLNKLPAGFQITSSPPQLTLQKNVGTYTIEIPFSFANNDMSFNVDIPYTYTINPVTLTAKVKNASRLYGDANPQFTTTYSGFVNNEDASVVTSNGSYATTATAKSDVGTYPIKQTGATAQNYVFDYEDGTLMVNKAPLTMTANDKTTTYGSKMPTLDATYEGLKNNETVPAWMTEPTLTTTATPTSRVAQYPITISNAVAKNYDLTIHNGTLTIEKAPLMAKVDNKSRLYGDANPQFTLTYTGLVNNETVPEWDQQPSFETVATTQSNVGSYVVSLKNALAVNYDITSVEGTLTVNKAPLKVTPKDAIRIYGEENPKFELLYEGLKNSENQPEWTAAPVITTNATKGSSVGEYAIQVKNAEARNYTLEENNGTLTVNKASLGIQVMDANKIYGSENPTFTLGYSGLKNNETAPEWITAPAFTTIATKASEVGCYDVTVTCDPQNYEITTNTAGKLTILKALLTIKANNVSMDYCGTMPTYSYTYSGFVNGDDETALSTSPSIATEATATSNAGEYTITPVEAEANNYDFTYIEGILTINKRPLIVKVNSTSRLYGEDNPTFTMEYLGFVNNETKEVLDTEPTISTTATLQSQAGSYDIRVSGGKAKNYTFNYENGYLTVTPRTLKAFVGDYERAYGENNPTFVIEYEGFVLNETEESLTTQPTTRTSATNTSNVGIYDIDVSGGYSPNYTFTYGSGVLTIVKAEQAITWDQDLSNLIIGDQVELKAEASSGLPITYTMDQTNVAEIYSAGNKTYLDCKSVGKVQIVAVQNGNINYYSSTRIRRIVDILDSANIPGDANNDKQVNVTDIVATVNYIMNKPSTDFNFDAADVNQDGEVNVTDIVAMVNIIMKDGTQNVREAMSVLRRSGFIF